jgi:hypothetical protein
MACAALAHPGWIYEEKAGRALADSASTRVFAHDG